METSAFDTEEMKAEFTADNAVAAAADYSIEKELEDLFKSNLGSSIESGNFLQMMFKGSRKANKADSVSYYFQRAKELLFDSQTPDVEIARIWDDNLTLGVCAKPLKAGDVAWKCEDCEKDPTCIICMDCFNNSDHEGHRTWLKTNVGGCCDCGDPEGWEMKGACHKHKGIDSSKEEALDALSDKVRERAPRVFRSLTRSMKTLLLGVIESKESEQAKDVYEQMVADFIEQSNILLESWKQCIFYLSEAYIDVFYGENEIKEGSFHKCCHRYFPDDQFRELYDEQKAIFESMSEDSAGKTYCTCTVIDLLFQADQAFYKGDPSLGLMDPRKNRKLNKKITAQCMQLFQSYNFKQHLGFAYVANMNTFLRHGGTARGLASLGVQILTMDSVTSRIIADPVLCQMVPDTLKSFIKEFIDSMAGEDGDNHKTLSALYQVKFLRYDLKYIAKPDLMPQLVETTTLIEDLIDGLALFQFQDAKTNPTEMEAYGDSEVQGLTYYATLDLELTSVIESKFLSWVRKPKDVARLFKFFVSKFAEIDNNFHAKHSEEGFFMVPIHRMFTYLFTRVLMSYYSTKRLDGVEDGDSSKELPSPNFSDYLVEAGIVQNSQDLQSLLEQALVTGARQMGYMAEIEVRKWIYKGERMSLLNQIENSAYDEKYLRMIALFQMAICSSEYKSRCIDILIHNFGTDDWLSAYLMSLASQKGPSKQMFQGLKNFATEKLAGQVQLLFAKLIEIAITEASFLLPSQKKLLVEPSEEKGKQRIQSMLGNHLRREMMHVLFGLGANATIDQIKKASHQVYLKLDKFTQAVVEMSTQQTDESGKKQFRLNQKAKFETMFDPYYIVPKKQESAQQTAYETFFKANPNCNNVVGDYEGNYKYQTGINRECWQAFAQSRLLIEVVGKTVSECLKNMVEVRGRSSDAPPMNEEEEFRHHLFPQQTLFMGLKLMIIVCQNCSDGDSTQGTLELIQELLPAELLTQAFDPNSCKDAKLSQIGLFLKGLIHKGAPTSETQANGTTAQASLQKTKSQAETLKAQKALAAKKKAAMLARMKKKQSNFIKEPVATSEKQPEDAIMQIDTAQAESSFSQSCASCQESLDINQFFERPFSQLCYLSSSKILYYASLQTVKSQSQSLQNLKEANSFNPTSVNQQEEEEEKKAPTSSVKDSASSHSMAQFGFDEEDPQQKYDSTVLDDLQLRGVINETYKTGVTFEKCCHAFHHDCLQQYQAAEVQLNFQKLYVKQMIGQDDNTIECPMCKVAKNTWQPLLPLGFDSDKDAGASRIGPYIDFCSQLIMNHINNPNNGSGPDERNLPTQILEVDIKTDPQNFVEQMTQVITYMVIEGTCLNNQKFLTPFNPQTQQSDVLLREVVYLLLTTREIVKRVCGSDSLKNIGESLLAKMANETVDGSILKANFQRLLVSLLIVCGVCIGDESQPSQTTQVKKAIIQDFYASFKGQVVLADTFRKAFGRLERGKVVSSTSETMHSYQNHQIEQSIESQLTFLRSATVMSLSIDALELCLTKAMPTFDCADAMQLHLNQALIEQLRQQVDDQAEFNLIISYLGVKPELSEAALLDKTVLLEEMRDTECISESVYASLVSLGRLDSDILTLAGKLAEFEPSADLPTDRTRQEDSAMRTDDLEEAIKMPINLHLLTTYFTFNFVELPSDFQSLVKQYYTRQCRGCRKQLQESAICLLCGEIVCMFKSQECCGNRPGMKKLCKRGGGAGMSFFQNATLSPEGEMSYHARLCEGGNSIFLCPQNATVYLVDQGRAVKGESPYRNALGETYSIKSAKWDNYLLSETSGGVQVLANLRKLFMEKKLPQFILQKRQEGEKVILRHAI